MRDRVLGCIVGGAIGDAWGGPYEGRTGPLEFSVSETSRISDDTQLTLATCEAYVADRRFSPENVAARLLDWYAAGRVSGLGSSTLKALRDLSAGAHWALSGSRGEYAAGNGVAMRVAPLAFVLDPGHPSDRTTIRDIARITHHSDEAYVGGLLVVGAIRSALAGSCSLETFHSVVNDLPEYSHVRERCEMLLERALPPSEMAAEFGVSGWVVESVPFAVYAACRFSEEPLEHVLKAVISAGGDTDTTAAIAGQIVGACIGRARIPDSLLAGIADIETVLAMADRFADAVEAV
ncbi:MAG: ADP-ribosylglycohydrolase family protein [Polyangiaceae bacterium]